MMPGTDNNPDILLSPWRTLSQLVLASGWSVAELHEYLRWDHERLRVEREREKR
jgi:hypothetical protein